MIIGFIVYVIIPSVLFALAMLWLAWGLTPKDERDA